MTKWREFLAEHAKFPFPDVVENGEVNTTNLSPFDVGLLAPEWMAQYAVRDENLIHKLCRCLEDMVRDKNIPDEVEEQLLQFFGNHLLSCTMRSGQEIVDSRWSMTNDGAYHSRILLEKGVFTAADACLQLYGGYGFHITDEHVAQGRSKVDFMGSIGEANVVLIEAKSPSVMKTVCDSLPLRGFKLNLANLAPNQPLVHKIFCEVALYLGLRKMEWLFLSCHNYWIVCRFVSGDDSKPFIAYSPKCSIEDSSEPFQAFLGAILSVKQRAAVQTSIFNPDIELNGILEENDNTPLPENNINERVRDSLRTDVSSRVPMTCSHVTMNKAVEPGLMITSSSPHFPESFQVWVHLQPLPNNTLVLPPHSQNGDLNQCLWLTHLIGFGSTGNVWQCHFDSHDGLFAVKVVEMLHRSDMECQQQFCNVFEAYLTLEMAYQSGKLCDHIAPCCYGAFKGDGINVLILELCDGTLICWDDLNMLERQCVYGLVWDLHKVGIVHGDLEPRNITRVPGGGFRLIDFSESRRHTCVEISGEMDGCFSNQLPQYRCPELRAMRNVLKLPAGEWTVSVRARHTPIDLTHQISSHAIVND